MTKQKQRRQNRGRGRKNFPVAPSSGALIYRGIIPQNTAETGIVATLRDYVTFNTGAGTGFNSQLDNNPSSADNWSEYSTSWSEYRVLGIRFEFVPQFSVNTTAVTTGPLVNSILHMAGAPSNTTYATSLGYGDAKLGHVTKSFVREWRMTEVNEAQFISTASPANTAYVFIAYADSLTTGTAYGAIFRTWLVQFRNSRY